MTEEASAEVRDKRRQSALKAWETMRSKGVKPREKKEVGKKAVKIVVPEKTVCKKCGMEMTAEEREASKWNMCVKCEEEKTKWFKLLGEVERLKQNDRTEKF